MTSDINTPNIGANEIEPDVSLKDSPVRKKRADNQRIPIIDGMEVPTHASLGLTLNPDDMPEEEDEVFGNEEFRKRTKDWQPRSRLSNSREMQFRSRAERIDYYKKSMDTQAFGKTYLPPELINDKENAYRWIRKTIRGRFDDDNIRSKERIGWIPATVDQAPSFAFFDYDGEVNDSATLIEGGGLYVGKLDIELYCHSQGKYNRKIIGQGKWNEKFDDDAGLRNRLDVPTQEYAQSAPQMAPQFQDPFKPSYQGQPVVSTAPVRQNPGEFAFDVPQYFRPGI